MNLKKTIILSVILAGATAMATQIVFLREFLAIFYGNEISIGIILASWLVWGAIGSLLLGRFSDAIRNKVRVFYACQLALSVVLPAVLLGIRMSKSLMGIATGEIVGYYPMMLATFSLLALPCAILAFMFSLSCRIYSAEADTPAGGIARVYSMESVGAILGGGLVSYVLIQRMEAFGIVFLFSALNVAGALAMESCDRPLSGWPRARRAAISAFLAALVVLYAFGWPHIRKFSLERLWSGFDVLESRDSIYGNIAVTQKGRQLSFYGNGLHLYTVPDIFTAEQAVHFPLLEHPSPKNILLIGGGVGGLLKEALKHPIKKVEYVELDPLIVKMARAHLPSEDAAFLDSPRVSISNADGRFFVKRSGEKYDCVIIALGDPYTAQLNRFYTVDFFREIYKVLNDGGVVSFSLTASANYIGEELAAYLRSINISLKEVFPEVLAVPGDSMLLLASNRKGVLTYDIDTLMGRIKERGIQAQYVREYYLFDVLSKGRIEYAEEMLKGREGAILNTDFKPISYYFATLFWSTQFDTPGIRRFLRSVTSAKIWSAAALFCLLLSLCVLLRRSGRQRSAALAAVMTTGFAEIIFQIVVILSFQVIYGHVFYKIGIIITSFMLGLAVGSVIMGKALGRLKDARSLFIATQVSICIYPLILPFVFMFFSGSGSATADWIGSNIVFPFLPVIPGVIGGVQFPLANRIYLRSGKETGRVSALSYGVDLLGACAGSLLAASFLVPVLGIFQTCILAGLINAVVLGLILVSR